MFLALLTYGTVIAFMALIMTKRVSVLTALIIVPIAAAFIGGFRGELGPMMLGGVTSLAPTEVMLAFAVLYFGIMIDAGLLRPRRAAGARRSREGGVSMAALALFVSLDGHR